jgi:capping protein beta
MSTEINGQQKIDFALDLMRRLPPQQIEKNLTNLIDLIPDQCEDLLSAVDQPLKIARDKKVGKDYLLCDYNRDGDSYRSPWTNTYDPPFEDGNQPSDNLRKLEIDANAAFEQYRDMYYEGGVSSVYLWDNEFGFAGVILIKKMEDGNSKNIKGCWDSIHVIEALERGQSSKVHYKLTSTVMLWLQTNKSDSGMMNLGGSLMRQKELDTSTNESTHIANIGRMVEEMENQIRQSLNTIYFDKTKSILNSLRSTEDGDEKAKRDNLRDELNSKVTFRQSATE